MTSTITDLGRSPFWSVLKLMLEAHAGGFGYFGCEFGDSDMHRSSPVGCQSSFNSIELGHRKLSPLTCIKGLTLQDDLHYRTYHHGVPIGPDQINLMFPCNRLQLTVDTVGPAVFVDTVCSSSHISAGLSFRSDDVVS